MQVWDWSLRFEVSLVLGCCGLELFFRLHLLNLREMNFRAQGCADFPRAKVQPAFGGAKAWPNSSRRKLVNRPEINSLQRRRKKHFLLSRFPDSICPDEILVIVQADAEHALVWKLAHRGTSRDVVRAGQCRHRAGTVDESIDS